MNFLKKANGIWKYQVGGDDGRRSRGFLEYLAVKPKWDKINTLSNPEFPLEESKAEFYSQRGKSIYSLPFDQNHKIYGFGLNFKELSYNGTVLELKTDHFSGTPGHTHAPVPFFFSDRGYGVFADTVNRLKVYVCGTHRKENQPEPVDRLDPAWKAVAPGSSVDIMVYGEACDLYIVAGFSPLEIVQRYNLLCGGGCLPPKWGLGFWNRVKINYNQKDCQREADEFEKRDFPLDVLGLEPGWLSASYPTTYEWNKERFPEPAKMLREMKKRGIRINLWENAFVHPQCQVGKKIFPSLCGTHTGGWGGLIPDLTMERARKIMAEQHGKEHVDGGVSGYKLDECDGYDQWLFPDFTLFPSGLTGDQMRQLYGLMFQKMTLELFRKRDQRTYGLVRATNSGGNSFPYVIYNDCNDHRDYITGLCNASLSGTLFTPEAKFGGSPEDWLRRIQAVCFSPLAMINAWASDDKPWTYPSVSDEIRAVMKLRLRFMPYLYTAFYDYSVQGIPPIRAMILEKSYQSEADEVKSESGVIHAVDNPYSRKNANDVKDQFMFGPHILCAPLFAGEESRKVLLPRGKWYDFYTGRLRGENEVITIGQDYRSVPLFVRDGGIIPLLAQEHRHLPSADDKPDLEVRHYGEKEGKYTLYDDDGTTFDYEEGACSLTDLCVERQGNILQGRVNREKESFPFSYGEIIWRFMSRSAGSR